MLYKAMSNLSNLFSGRLRQAADKITLLLVFKQTAVFYLTFLCT